MCDFFVRSKRRQLGHNGFVGEWFISYDEGRVRRWGGSDEERSCCFRPVLSETTPDLNTNSRGALID